MTFIRYSLLADETDSGEIKQGLLAAALCFLLSLLIHLLFFTVWQLLDGDASDNFHFVLLGESTPPIELVLTFGETGADDQSSPGDIESLLDSVTAGRPASEGGLFSPTDAWAENSFSGDFWQNLPDGQAPGDSSIEGLPQGLTPDIQSGIPPSMVDDSLARTVLVPDSAEGSEDEINPDPPISLEHTAPEYRSYETMVSSAIMKLWILSPEARAQFRPGRLSILFTISRDGQLIRQVVQKSTGKTSLDHAGMEALRSAAPFPPFPPELAHQDQMDIIIHFDYKYKPSYRRNSNN